MFLLNELYRELRKLVKAAKVGRKATKVFDRILSGRGLHTAKVCRPGFPSSRNNLHSVGVKVDGCPFVFPGVIEFGFNVPTGAMAKQLTRLHDRAAKFLWHDGRLHGKQRRWAGRFRRLR